MLDDRPARRPLSAACPYLGLPDDPETRFSFADAAHRCRATGKPVQIDLGHQGAFCLTTTYPGCKRFGASALGAPAAGAAATAAVLPDGAAKHDTSTDSSRKVKVLRSLVGALVLAGLLLVAGAVGSGSFQGLLGATVTATPTPTPVPTAAQTASSVPTSNPTPTPGPTPTPSPTATPTETPSPSPSASPSPAAVIHLVARGESLTSIASLYGVTAKSIQIANKIANPSLIFVGQRLVIPPAP